MGTINVKDFKISTSIGVTDEERSFPSLLTMQLCVHLNLRNAGAIDEVGETVDYDKMLQVLRECCSEGSCRLLERLILKCAEALFEEFALIEQVDIELEKNIFADTSSVSVSDSFCRGNA